MNASNPIKQSNHVTLAEIFHEEQELTRQDLGRLHELLREAPRGGLTYTSSDPPRSKAEIHQLTLVTKKSKVEKSDRPKGTLKIPAIYVSHKVPRDLSYIPTPGIHQDGPYVSTKRNYGTTDRPELVVRSLLEYSTSPDAAAKLIDSYVFSKGTPDGLEKRLNKFLATKTVKMTTHTSIKSAMATLQTRLHTTRKLKSWTGKNSWDIISSVKISKNSSAGPGFWKEKGRCLGEIVKAVEDFIAASNGESLDEYMSKHPELFIAECKNKEDRYETSKINDKTRPYWNFSAPMALLASAIMQPLTANLDLFTENPKSYNAYGFAWAHGGGEKMWKWATETKIGEKKVAIYGDDAKMVWRTNEGLFEVNPDFEQMDASIDIDTAELAAVWAFTQVEKDPQTEKVDGLQANIISMWRHMATRASFIVDSSTTYSKEGGLRTGVVGTTLIDTIKSIIAYEDFISTGGDPNNRLQFKQAMHKHGLRVKEGTYNPRKINETPEEGTLALDTFLGAQTVWIQGSKRLEPIPYISLEKGIQLAGNPKMPPLVSQTHMHRYLFDFARGQMLTFAHLHDELWDAMIRLVEILPPSAIALRIQNNRGGELPEYAYLFGEADDFVWPTSDGIPSRNYCKNISLSPDNQIIEGSRWEEVFPGFKDQLKTFKATKQKMETVRSDGTWVGDIEAEATKAKLSANLPDSTEITVANKSAKMPGLVRTTEENLNKTQEQILTAFSDLTNVELSCVPLEALGFSLKNVVKHFLSKGWRITGRGSWSKDPKSWTKSMTNKIPIKTWAVYQKELGEDKTGPSPSTSTENSTASTTVMVEHTNVFLDNVPKLLKRGGIYADDVSFVHGWAQRNKVQISTESAPPGNGNPLNTVKIFMTTEDERKLVGEGMSKKSDIAKKTIYQQLAEHVAQFLRDNENQPTPTAEAKTPTMTEKIGSVVVNEEEIGEIVRNSTIKVPRLKSTNVQYVKQLVNSNGGKITVGTKVLSNSPHPVVETTVKNHDATLATSLHKNKREGEALCFDAISAEMDKY